MAFTVNDINTLESNEDASDLDIHIALQRAINSGMWSLQGSYGRSMMEAITAGKCMVGLVRSKDAYGNVIPCRGDLRAGTKGTYDFVVERSGQEWADAMQDVA